MTDGSSALKAQGDTPLLRKWKFQAAIAADPELNADAKNVAFVLLDILNNDEGYARPGYGYIAKQAGSNVSTVRRATAQLRKRGWFSIAASRSDKGDPDTNRYYPLWKRAGGQAPAGSERKRKAPRTVRSPAEPIVYEAGMVRLTAAELEDVKQRVGRYWEPLLSGLNGNPLEWTEENWRDQFERRVAIWAEPDDDADLPADPAESEDAEQPVEAVRPVPDPAPQRRPVKPVSRPVPQTRQALPSLPDFKGRHITIRSVNVNRWAAEFSNIPDLIAAMNEIEPDISREPDVYRQSAMKTRLRKLNDALRLQSETISPDPAHAGADAVEAFPF